MDQKLKDRKLGERKNRSTENTEKDAKQCLLLQRRKMDESRKWGKERDNERERERKKKTVKWSDCSDVI